LSKVSLARQADWPLHSRCSAYKIDPGRQLGRSRLQPAELRLEVARSAGALPPPPPPPQSGGQLKRDR